MNNSYTKNEADRVRELYDYYIQFNFEQFALNKITWDTGLSIETIKEILSRHP